VYTFDGNPVTAGTDLPVGNDKLIYTFYPLNVTDPGYYSMTKLATGSVTLTVTPVPALEPVFTPAAGTYPAGQLVTLTDTTPGATIYYTTNGSKPTKGVAGTSEYTVPFVVDTNETVRAIAVAPGYANSGVASTAYKFIGSPSALAVPATAIDTPTATLNGIVNTNDLAGSYWFQYGTSSSTLTTMTPSNPLPASATSVPVSNPISGLLSGTTYYFQVVVTTAGGTSSGAVLSFTAN
jgi:hypothetical protein